jgi:predicted dinucleotide-binding enzyme
VIETNNYYPQQRDGRIEALENGTPESVWVSDLLGVPVYKVFNGIFWKHLLERGTPRGDAARIGLPVAGADGPAKDTVFALIDELGFDPVDAGPLEESWRQSGSPVYGKDYDAEGEGLAEVATVLGEPDTAAVLCAEAATVRAETGIPRLADD